MQHAPLRKHLDLSDLLQRRQQIESLDFWRSIKPDSEISTDGHSLIRDVRETPGLEDAEYASQLLDEGYFQTAPALPEAMRREMLDCIDVVQRRGFPAMFCLVYDVFYSAFSCFHSTLAAVLGPEYKLIPNFWVYYISPSDESKGFEPHRDAEYVDTINRDGMPTVLTVWVSVTAATPLNSCMYIVPKSRDPQYSAAVHDLTTDASQFALEDIRALPAQAGVLSCWDQYVFHWGSRSSSRAPSPRVSYAAYCQRGDRSPVDNALLDLQQGIDFSSRLGLICKGLYRYSYLSVEPSPSHQPLMSFLEKHIDGLRNS